MNFSQKNTQFFTKGKFFLVFRRYKKSSAEKFVSVEPLKKIFLFYRMNALNAVYAAYKSALDITS